MRIKIIFQLILIYSIVFGLNQIAVLDGHSATGKFGYAIAGRLDFNHDGLADVFIGEPGWSKVYGYFGSVPFDTIPDLIFTGTAGTQFGACLASIKDINQDGIDDLAIGAPRDNSGGAAAGRVFLYFGSQNPDTSVDLILTGPVNSARFGTSISGSYDVNSDSGFDILIGAPGDQHAFLFLGGTMLDTVPDLILRDGNGDYFGNAVALLGDVNGDTFGDMLVGDYRHSGSILHGGGCFLYLGGNPLNPNVDIVWEGDEENRQLGITVASAGDLNYDGLNDIALGASMTDKVHIHFGSPYIGLQPDVVLQGSDWFGCWIAGQADINQDNFNDLLVGADGDYYGLPSGPGYVYLFLGGEPMSTTPDTILAGEADEDMFGSCVEFCDDINNNQYIEFCIGAPGHDSQGINAGRAYIYNKSYAGIDESYFTKIKNDSLLRIIPGTIVNSNHPIMIECRSLGNQKKQLKVIDVLGRIVFSKNIKYEEEVIKLPVLGSGVYLVILQIGSYLVKNRLILVQ